MVTGRVLEPDQSKRPLHASKRTNPCSVVGCTAKAKASLLCKTKTKKTRANGKKYAARSSAKKVVRAVPALQHACGPGQMCTPALTTVRTGSTQPGGAKSLQHTETKKGFFHAFQRRQSDLLLLQAAATSFKPEGFAAIRTPCTGSARLMGALRVLGKMVSAQSMLPLGSAL